MLTLAVQLEDMSKPEVLLKCKVNYICSVVDHGVPDMTPLPGQGKGGKQSTSTTKKCLKQRSQTVRNNTGLKHVFDTPDEDRNTSYSCKEGDRNARLAII